jgi:spore coat polysaccharide biosynthesis predicted glycosyltransferase SpsG
LTQYDYDIGVLSDFRFPGGTSASLAEEIRAQSSAGYTTALIPARAVNLKRRRGFNSRIVSAVQAGQGELVAPDAEINVKLLVIRQPSIFVEDPDPIPRVKADKVLMIVNQIHSNGAGPDAYAEGLAETRDRLRAMFGDQITWAPIGPIPRTALTKTHVSLELAEADWHNVLNADEWWLPRDNFVAERPVIGRHGRPTWKKWPESAEEILAAYPDDDRFGVKILGGGEVAAKIIGRVPDNWVLYPFNSIHPRRFLGEIDFQVYYHHPGEPEAFGRTIAEALASGTPTIVSPDFRPLFEEACIYAEPAEVKEIVTQLYSDPGAYQERAEYGHTFIKERFGHEVHKERVRKLIGEPTSRPRVARSNQARRTVLFFTSNGAGMGHLTRMMAIARRLPSSVRPIFATLSTGMQVVREAGYFCEYIPRSPGYKPSEWNGFLEQRLTEIIRRYDIDTLVFDGTVPFQGLLGAKEATGVPGAWCRRAMWQEGKSEKIPRRAKHFELVIEPGEFAEDYDRGITVAHREEATRVRPILLLDESEVLDRGAAREELGLSQSGLAVLVGLGAGNDEDTASPTQLAVEKLLRDPNIEVVVAEWVIQRAAFDLPDRVKPIKTYPISRLLRAFDFAFSAAGYNSYHEHIAFGVPTIFIPTQTQLDDQPARARYAESAGVGLSLDPFSEAGLERRLELMLQKDSREEMSDRCRELFPGNGAEDAMKAVEQLVMATSPGGTSS